jgi:hypothetical protein
MQFKKTTITIIVLLLFMSIGYSQKLSDTIRFTKFRVGSYGEILYQKMDYSPNRYNYSNGAPSQNRSIIGIPRMNLSFDYKLTPTITIGAEIEFEYGGTGTEMEVEYDEAGEYEAEVEKGGEVAIEQLHITKKFSDAFSLRVGHIIVPVGQTNPYHEPIKFFGTTRPEGEKTLIPLTWHETGISIFGTVKRWHYEFQLVNGLDANGFSSEYWVSSGKQGRYENTKMTQPALAGRIENTSIKDLRLSLSGYYGNSAKNTEKPEKMSGIKGNVSIISSDAEYKNNRFVIRANVLAGHLTDSYQISQINKNLQEASQYKRTPVGSDALTWAIETGYDIFPLLNIKSKDKLFPFIRYEYYNSMENTAKEILADKRYKRNVITAGFNYYPLPNLALKIDYAHRTLGNGDFNNENTMGIALVYTAWFWQK